MFREAMKRLMPTRVRRRLKGLVVKEPEFKSYVTTVSCDGMEFPYLIGDRVAEDWYGDCRALSTEWAFTKGLVSPGDVVFQVGAHQGFTTVFLAKWVGQNGAVIAFEASPFSTRILQKNVELNSLENVVVVGKAVGAQAGLIGTTGGSSVVAVTNRWDAATDVEMVTLDEYANTRPTLLKIDVEGYEVAVLEGASRILSSRPKLAIEVHVSELALFGKTPRDVLDLVPADYELWLQPDGHSVPERFHGYEIAGQDQVHLYAIPRGS